MLYYNVRVTGESAPTTCPGPRQLVRHDHRVVTFVDDFRSCPPAGAPVRTPTPAMCREARLRFQAAESAYVQESLPARGPADEPGCLGGGVRSRGQLSHLQVRPGCVAKFQGLSGLMPFN